MVTMTTMMMSLQVRAIGADRGQSRTLNVWTASRDSCLHCEAHGGFAPVADAISAELTERETSRINIKRPPDSKDSSEASGNRKAADTSQTGLSERVVEGKALT